MLHLPPGNRPGGTNDSSPAIHRRVLESGHFERVTLPRDRRGVMVGSRFRVTGVAMVGTLRDRRGDAPKADLINVASRCFGTTR